MALLPVAFYVMRRGKKSFDTSSSAEDAVAQDAIRRWFVFATLKRAFRASSDTILARLRALLTDVGASTPFPASNLYTALGIEPQFTEAEIDRILDYGYQGQYTTLVLSLLHPDRDWKDAVFHEDHIFPQAEFQPGPLKRRGYDDARVQSYIAKYNSLPNLELLTDTENISKSAKPFEEWIRTRDPAFRQRHLIPELTSYGFDAFEDFFAARRASMVAKLKELEPHQ